MRRKVKELEGAELDWAVADALGLNPVMRYMPNRDDPAFIFVEVPAHEEENYPGEMIPWPASTDWAIAGPLIESERIGIGFQHELKGCPNPAVDHPARWIAQLDDGEEEAFSDMCEGASGKGSTPLIAAMRAFVASRLGDDVELP